MASPLLSGILFCFIMASFFRCRGSSQSSLLSHSTDCLTEDFDSEETVEREALPLLVRWDS